MLSNLKPAPLPPLEFKPLPDTSSVWRDLPYEKRMAKIREVARVRAQQLPVRGA